MILQALDLTPQDSISHNYNVRATKNPCAVPVGHMQTFFRAKQTMTQRPSSCTDIEWSKSTRGPGWGYPSQYCVCRWKQEAAHCRETGTLQVGGVHYGILLRNWNSELAPHPGARLNPINREGRNAVTCSTKPLTHSKNIFLKNYTDTCKWIHVKLVKPE